MSFYVPGLSEAESYHLFNTASEIEHKLEESKKNKEQFDSTVSHPNHYASDTGLECYKAIRAMLGREGFIAYCQGNIVKYMWRWKQKNGEEDLHKALEYAKAMVDPEYLDFEYKGDV